MQLNPIKGFVDGIKAKFVKDLSAKGLAPASIEAEVKALEAKLEPIAKKFAPDLSKVNEIFFKGQLTPQELSNFEQIASTVVALAHDAEVVLEEVKAIEGK